MSITLAQLEQETARASARTPRLFTDRQIPNTAQFTFANVPHAAVADRPRLGHQPVAAAPRRHCDGTPCRSTSSTVSGWSRATTPRGAASSPTARGARSRHRRGVRVPPPEPAAGTARGGSGRTATLFPPRPVQAQPTQQYGGIDLTAQFPWLTDPWQIEPRAATAGCSPTTDAPLRHVSQRRPPDPDGHATGRLPVSMWLNTWRPAWSRVNGARLERPHR